MNCTPLMGISHASEQNKEAALKRTLYDPAAKTLWRPPFSGLSRPWCIVLEIREHLNQLLQQDGDFHSIPQLCNLCALRGVRCSSPRHLPNLTARTQQPPKQRPGSAFPWSRAGSCAPPWGEACPGKAPNPRSIITSDSGRRTTWSDSGFPSNSASNPAHKRPRADPPGAPRPKRLRRAGSCRRIVRPAPCTPRPAERQRQRQSSSKHSFCFDV